MMYEPLPLATSDDTNYQPAPAAMAGQQQCVNMVNTYYRVTCTGQKKSLLSHVIVLVVITPFLL